MPRAIETACRDSGSLDGFIFFKRSPIQVARRVSLKLPVVRVSSGGLLLASGEATGAGMAATGDVAVATCVLISKDSAGETQAARRWRFPCFCSLAGCLFPGWFSSPRVPACSLLPRTCRVEDAPESSKRWLVWRRECASSREREGELRCEGVVNLGELLLDVPFPGSIA